MNFGDHVSPFHLVVVTSLAPGYGCFTSERQPKPSTTGQEPPPQHPAPHGDKKGKFLYLGTYCVFLSHSPEDARQEHVAQSRRDKDDEGIFMDC